jgi:tetratricopeptide (TPR) repeat protein
MSGERPTTRFLRLLLASGGPSRESLRQFLKHHLEVCPDCRGELEGALLPADGGAASDYRDALARALELVAEKERDWPAVRAAAQQEFAELMRFIPSVRRLKVNRAISRFKSPHLVDLLIEESRWRLADDPHDALELAECAQAVALRVSTEDFGQGLAITYVARANAHRGNALRVAGDLKEAERLLEFAVALFGREGSGDPLVEAELLAHLASLRNDQRRFEEAHIHLDAAIGVYERLLEVPLVARSLVQKAVFLYDAGDPRSAIPVVLKALGLIDRQADPKLHLCAEHNLTDYVQEVGRYAEARERMRSNALLYDQFPDPWTQLRRQWVAGKILRGLGEMAAAGEVLTGVRRGFLAKGSGFHAALAGLDLALVYIGQGRNDRVRDLAREMVPIFLAQDIQREATAALALFEEAARRDAVTAAMVVELTASMRRVRPRQAEQAS